jgi:DNA polymerase-1
LVGLLDRGGVTNHRNGSRALPNFWREMKFNTVIVDGDNLAWKSFYALSSLSHDGRPTGAIFGTVNALLSYYKKYEPDYLIVTWTSRTNFRKDIYPEYKAKRKEKDNNYFEQRHIVEKLLSAMGINQAEVPGFEADDIMAEVALLGIEDGSDVLIISGDKDLLQLVSYRVMVLRNDKLYDSQTVFDEFGCKPMDIPLWLAINGDKSDNIKGVPKIGPKKIAKLFSDYTGILKSLIFTDDTSPVIISPVLEKVREHRETVDINLKLIELKSGRTEPKENIIHKQIDQDKVVKMIENHGMNSLLVPVLELMNGRTSI